MASETDEAGRRAAAAEGEEQRRAPFFPPRGDVAVALVVLVVVAILYAVTLNIEEAPRALARGMQPRDFPQLVLGLIAVLAVILLVNAGPPRARAAAPGSRLTVALTALACVGAVLVFEHVGLIMTIVLYAAALPLLWGERRFGLVAAYAVLLPLAVWGVFAGILDVYFPSAVLDFFVR